MALKPKRASRGTGGLGAVLITGRLRTLAYGTEDEEEGRAREKTGEWGDGNWKPLPHVRLCGDAAVERERGDEG